MAINVVNYGFSRFVAANRGASEEAANRIGVIGAVMPTPITALVVASSMADREASQSPEAAEALPPIRLKPKPDATGAPTPGGTGTEPTGETGEDLAEQLWEKLDGVQAAATYAKASADEAKAVAERNQEALAGLGETVRSGFARIEEKLGGSSPPPPSPAPGETSSKGRK